MDSNTLIELLEFHLNDKAISAIKIMEQKTLLHERKFYHGQYMAFNEIYSMLQNIKGSDREKEPD
jgi:hypothetical protein